MSKLTDAPYNSGRSHDWIKTKCSDRQEFVVAGLVPSTADMHAVGALVLGVYDGGKLKYAGRTGTGFTHEMARSLYRKLKAIEMTKPPFDAIPAEERGVRKPMWVQPKVVVEVDFRGWTHGDRVRQASFQGVREDKTAEDVVCEKAMAAASRTAGVRRSAPVEKKQRQRCRRASHASRPDLLGGCRHHQARSCRLLCADLEMDAAAPSRSANCTCCVVRKAHRVNAFFKNMRAPASRSSIFILFRKKATRLFPSTISMA